jgi:hypothetical protein
MNEDKPKTVTVSSAGGDWGKTTHYTINGRIISLDGDVPFEEVKNVSWRLVDESGNRIFAALFTSNTPPREADYFHAMMDGGD